MIEKRVANFDAIVANLPELHDGAIITAGGFGAPVARREATHAFDLSRWSTRPCVVIIGVLRGEAGEDLVAVADVGDERGHLGADLGDLVGDAVDAFGAYVDQRDGRAVTGQAQSDPAADTACRAGHQRDSSGECHCHCSPFGSMSTFIFVPACSASKPSSITSSRAMRVTQPVVS